MVALVTYFVAVIAVVEEHLGGLVGLLLADEEEYLKNKGLPTGYLTLKIASFQRFTNF